MKNRGNTLLLLIILVLGLNVLTNSFTIHIGGLVWPVAALGLAYYFHKKGSAAKWLFFVLGTAFIVVPILDHVWTSLLITVIICYLIYCKFSAKEIDMDKDLPPLSSDSHREEVK